MHSRPVLWGDKKVRNTRLNGLRGQPEGAAALIGHCHPLSLLFPLCLLFNAVALCGPSVAQWIILKQHDECDATRSAMIPQILF